MADTGASRDLYRRWIHELWGGDDAHRDDTADELVHDDFVGHWPDRDVTGRRALLDLIGETHSAFDQLSFVVAVGPVAEGDLVAGRWAGEGENADGPATFFGNDIVRLADGKVVEYWTVAAEAGKQGSRGRHNSGAGATGDAGEPEADSDEARDDTGDDTGDEARDESQASNDS